MNKNEEIASLEKSINELRLSIAIKGGSLGIIKNKQQKDDSEKIEEKKVEIIEDRKRLISLLDKIKKLMASYNITFKILYNDSGQTECFDQIFYYEDEIEIEYQPSYKSEDYSPEQLLLLINLTNQISEKYGSENTVYLKKVELAV